MRNSRRNKAPKTRTGSRKAGRDEIHREHGLYIEGELCPHCHYWLGQDGSPDHPWGPTFRAGHREDVPVVRVAFSEKDRLGIGTFAPSDPKSQDISELTGGIDLATIGDGFAEFLVTDGADGSDIPREALVEAVHGGAAGTDEQLVVSHRRRPRPPRP